MRLRPFDAGWTRRAWPLPPPTRSAEELFGAGLEQTLEAAAVLGHRWLVLPWIPAGQRTPDGYRAVAERLNVAGATARTAGMRVAYHNHAFEFETLEAPGRPTGYALLLDHLDSAVVDMEIDFHWTAAGGADPAALFAAHPGRFVLCHLKDRDARGRMTDVGDGDIDWDSLLGLSTQAGLVHFFVEHDNPADPLDSIRNSWRYLKRAARPDGKHMTDDSRSTRRVRTRDFARLKEAGQPIAMVTAYDAMFASLVDQAGIDAVLVGDSLATVLCAEETTLGATMEQMIYHGRLVCRGTKRALVVVDMPFMSYQVSPEDAVRNAGRIMKETGAGAVKLEGGAEVAGAVERMVEAGIPVMGHLGFTPQSVHRIGGNRVQGRDEGAVEALIRDAQAVEAAGAFSVLLELMVGGVAQQVAQSLSVPTVGIGAGPHCDGQLLILHDLLGLNEDFNPRFLKRYARLGEGRALGGGTVRGRGAGARLSGRRTCPCSLNPTARIRTLARGKP